jgi:hypothetical protein
MSEPSVITKELGIVIESIKNGKVVEDQIMKSSLKSMRIQPQLKMIGA